MCAHVDVVCGFWYVGEPVDWGKISLRVELIFVRELIAVNSVDLFFSPRANEVFGGNDDDDDSRANLDESARCSHVALRRCCN